MKRRAREDFKELTEFPIVEAPPPRKPVVLVYFDHRYVGVFGTVADIETLLEGAGDDDFIDLGQGTRVRKRSIAAYEQHGNRGVIGNGSAD